MIVSGQTSFVDEEPKTQQEKNSEPVDPPIDEEKRVKLDLKKFLFISFTVGMLGFSLCLLGELTPHWMVVSKAVSGNETGHLDTEEGLFYCSFGDSNCKGLIIYAQIITVLGLACSLIGLAFVLLAIIRKENGKLVEKGAAGLIIGAIFLMNGVMNVASVLVEEPSLDVSWSFVLCVSGSLFLLVAGITAVLKATG